MNRICDEILKIDTKKPLLIGIDGVDGSGKTEFAKRLATLISASTNRKVLQSSVDYFHNPTAIRHQQGMPTEKSYFQHSFNYDALKNKLLDPLKSNTSGKCVLKHFDHHIDKEIFSKEILFTQDTILIFEGIFLHRDELYNYWDYSIFLETSFEETYKRMAVRNGCSSDPKDPANKRYYAGQNLYLKSCTPKNRATVVIDNNDFKNPIRL